LDKILLIGSAGSVGHDIMYLISALNYPIKVVGADIDEDKGRKEVDECLHVAHNLGNYPELAFRKIDLFNVEETTEILKEVEPKVICNLASLGSWWVTRLLPPEIYNKICPIAPWLPNHLTLAHKLMKAVKRSGIEAHVVNGAYPDLTNVVLDNIGLAPTCGGGNMDLGCSRVRKIVADEMGLPVENINVYGVGHHGAFYTAGMKGPLWFKILASGEDVSAKFPPEKIARLYSEWGYTEKPSFEGPLVDQMKTASSFLKIILALYYDTGVVHHAIPGPNGLPGAYPTRLSGEGAEVVLPDLSLEEAIEINRAGARIDGVEQVKDDGTVVFVEENVEMMRGVLDYECEELRVSEAEERAMELDEKLKKLFEKYGVS